MNEQLSGIINVLKPSCMTSHDLVYKIRKKFNIQKVGSKCIGGLANSNR